MRIRPDTLELYLSRPGPCPYLEGLTEQKVLTALDEATAPLAPFLTERGFRRMQNTFYRQQCPACRACIPTRMKLGEFRPGGNLRRILKKNADLSCSLGPPDASPENYDLFMRYLKARHDEGGMARMSYNDYIGMMEEYPADTRFLIARDGAGKTAGIMLFDELPDGVSAVYSYYDPDLEKRSLGTYLILQLAEYAAGTGRPYLYLGFWVKNSPKMQYKARFQPLQMLVNEQWVAFRDE